MKLHGNQTIRGELRIGRKRCGLVLAALLCALATNAAPPAREDPDTELTAALRGRTRAVTRWNREAGELAVPLFPLPPEPPAPPPETNAPPVEEDRVIVVRPSVVSNTPPVFVLTAVYIQQAGGRSLARLNGRLVAEGEAAGNNLRVAAIGSDHVVLVDTQGVRRVVSLFSR